MRAGISGLRCSWSIGGQLPAVDVRLFAANPITRERGEQVDRLDLPPNALAFSFGHQVRVREAGA